VLGQRAMQQIARVVGWWGSGVGDDVLLGRPPTQRAPGGVAGGEGERVGGGGVVVGEERAAEGAVVVVWGENGGGKS